MTSALKAMVAMLWMSREAKRFLWIAMRGTRRTLRKYGYIHSQFRINNTAKIIVLHRKMNHLLVGKEDDEGGREGEGGGDVEGDVNVLLGQICQR